MLGWLLSGEVSTRAKGQRPAGPAWGWGGACVDSSTFQACTPPPEKMALGIPRKLSRSMLGILPMLKTKVKMQNSLWWENLSPFQEKTDCWCFAPVLLS